MEKTDRELLAWVRVPLEANIKVINDRVFEFLITIDLKSGLLVDRLDRGKLVERRPRDRAPIRDAKLEFVVSSPRVVKRELWKEIRLLLLI